MRTKLGVWIAVAASGGVLTAGVVITTLQLASASNSNSSTGTAAAAATTAPGQAKKLTPSPSPVVTITATPSPAPTSAAANPPAKSLTISPLAVSDLAPGVSKAASLLITNPNSQAVVLQSVVPSIGGATPAPSGLRPCRAGDFFVTVAGYNSATGTGPTGTIPAHSTAAVPVTVGMVNTNDNQDNCKGKTYSLSFTATATSK